MGGGKEIRERFKDASIGAFDNVKVIQHGVIDFRINKGLTAVQEFELAHNYKQLDKRIEIIIHCIAEEIIRDCLAFEIPKLIREMCKTHQSLGVCDEETKGEILEAIDKRLRLRHGIG